MNEVIYLQSVTDNDGVTYTNGQVTEWGFINYIYQTTNYTYVDLGSSYHWVTIMNYNVANQVEK